MRSDRRARLLKLALLVGAVAGGAALCSSVVGDETAANLEARREYIENLGAEEKEELRLKKERFDALPPDEQEQLRQLHEQISQRPDSDQIQEVMQRYNQWLKTLTSSQRAELQSMPAERRLAQIQRLMSEQERKLLERLAKGEEIPPEDLRAILDWLAEFIEKHEDEILATMAESYQDFYRSNVDKAPSDPRRREWDLKRARYYLYLRHLQHAFDPNEQRSEDEQVILPGEKDLNDLQTRLTEKSRKLLDPSKPAAERLATAQKWIRAAMLSKMGPPLSDDALRRFLERQVEARKREELESLPPHRMREELIALYWRHIREGGWSRRPGQGGPPQGAMGGSRNRRGDFRGPRDGSRGDHRGPDSPKSKHGESEPDDQSPRD